MGSLANWEKQILDIVLDVASRAGGGIIQDVLDAVALEQFSDLPPPIGAIDFDPVLYVQDVFRSSNIYLQEDLFDFSRQVERADVYTFILDFISEKDGFGRGLLNNDGTFLRADPDFDEFTWLFLQGARATNASANGANVNDPIGEIANDYNNAQYFIRTGSSSIPGSDGDTNNATGASNRIADLIAQEILSVANPDFPTLYQLGQEDGQVGARNLWFGAGNSDFGPGGFGIDIGGWAGNPFFMVLRAPQFFQRDVLYLSQTGGTADNPQFGGAYQDYASGYDLIAWVKSLEIATDGGLLALLRIEDLYDQLDGSPDSLFTAFDSIYQANGNISSADDFLGDAYGDVFSVLSSVLTGPAFNFFFVPQNMAELFTKAAGVPGQGVIALGTNSRTNGDVIGPEGGRFRYTSDFNDFIHAGFGDDLIIADGGSDTIDGGEGFDTVDYTAINVQLNYFIEDGSQFDEFSDSPVAQTFIASVSRGDWLRLVPFVPEDALFGIEKIVAGAQDDKFHIGRLNRVLELDGGEGEDTISFRDFGSAITLTIANETDFASVASDAFAGLILSNMEIIEGSEFGDTFLISELSALDPDEGANNYSRVSTGEGFDTVDFSAILTGLTVNLQAGQFVEGSGTIFGTSSRIEVANEAGQEFVVYDAESLVLTDQDDDVSGDVSISTTRSEFGFIDLGAGEDIANLRGAENVIVQGGDGADEITTDDADDVLVGGSLNLNGVPTFGEGLVSVDDNTADTLTGGDGYDRYFAGNGDVIKDSDGRGTIDLNGIVLTGGNLVAESSDACANGENDNRSDDARIWRNEDTGETYRLSNGDLIVEGGSAVLTIEGWESGDLGITLNDETPSDGGDCQPPESDPDGDGGDGDGGGSGSPDAFASPLVLDLDGDGLDLTLLERSVAFFDIDSDGIRERTSWVSADDGLLVLDRNGNGLIDSGQELFGYGETVSGGSRAPGDDVFGGFFDPQVVDISGPNDLELDFRSGFEVLSDLDTNNDLVIDASDIQFNELRVWRDLNQDGVSQEEELFSLPEVGVLSISLEGQSVFLEDTGNLITDTSTYQTTDGQAREVSDVWFRFNQYDTRFDAPDDLDPLIAALPSLNGSGAIVPLHLAMAENSTLQSLVEEFSTLTLLELGRVPVLMDQILYEWAGASEVHFESRGRYADARQVAVMEAFTDTPFAQWSGGNPRPQAGAVLGDQFSVITQSFAARLIAQSNLGQELIPELSYQYNQFLILEQNVDSSVVLQRLTDNLPTDVFDALAYLQAGVRLLDMIYLSFSDVAAAADAGAGYRATVEGILTSVGLNLTYGQLLGAQVGGDGADQILTDSARENGFLPDAPVVSGGRGDDEIIIGGGEQIALWGSGQGNDTIEIDPIVRTAIDFQPRVTIYMQNLDRSEVSFQVQDSDFNKELIVQIDATGETLTIENLGTVRGEAGQLIFADGTIVLFSELASILAEISATGGAGDDLVVQVNNEFTLDGGAGDDVLIGISGDTEYAFDVGGGNDIIRDDNVGDNQISFGPNLLSSDVEFERGGIQESDLIIRIISTGETLTIQNQFLRETPVVSQFFFQSDFNELEAQDIANQFLEDDAGDNTVLGTGADETFDLDAGNDLIRGFNGSDTYRIGSQSFGQDTIDDGGRLGEDTIVFQANVLADFQISQDNGDFIFTNTNNGDELRVRDSIETYQFLDTTFSRADLIAFVDINDAGGVVGTTGDDTFGGTEDRDVYSGLAGNDTIDGNGGEDLLRGDDGDDIIRGGADNDRLEGGQGEDVLEGGTGDDILIAGDTAETPSALQSDNTLRGNTGNDQLFGGWRNDLLEGGAGEDFLQGDFGNDTYDGGADNDIFVDTDGDSVYRYNLGDGDDLILDDGGTSSSIDTDAIEFGPGITAADLTFSFVQIDDTSFTDYFGFEDGQIAIRADIAGGGSVTFSGNAVGSVPIAGSFELRFDDGSTLTANAITAALRAESSGDQTIAGVSRFSDDTLTGGAGDDTFFGNRGDQTFVFGFGDGQDTVINPGPISNTTTLLLAAGVTAADVTISRSGEFDQNLVVTLSSGDSVTFVDNFVLEQDLDDPNTLIDYSYLDQITFVDDAGTVLTVADFLAATNAQTAGDDLVIGSDLSDAIGTSAGNDELRGGLGSDSYEFGIGSGSDTIVETDRGFTYFPIGLEGEDVDLSNIRETDTLNFSAGLTQADVTFTAVGDDGNDLLIEITSTGEQLLIENQFVPGNFGQAIFILDEEGNFISADEWVTINATAEILEQRLSSFTDDTPLFSSGIEVFSFSDGTTLTRDQVAQLTPGVIEPVDPDDELITTDDGGGTLDGGAGFDRLEGGSGGDDYILGIGYDEDTISDAGGFDIVFFDTGIDFQNIAFSRVGENSNDLLIEVGGSQRSALIIEGQFNGGDNAIEEFETDAGQFITALEIQNLLLIEASTSGDDYIIGFETGDIINARAGDDTIEVRGGDDLVDGGEGRDTVIFRGARSNYDITEVDGVTIVTDLTGVEGTDRLVNVEVLRFLGDENTPDPESVALVENLAPTATPLAFDTREDTRLTLNASQLIDGAADPDGGGLTLESVGNPINGEVSIDANGRVNFVPAEDFVGEASFTYTVTDSEGLTATSTVTVSVTNVNDAPIIPAGISDQASDEDTALSLAIPADAFDDIDGDALTLTAALSNGDALPSWLSFDGTTFTGTPPQDFNGSLAIEVTATDGESEVSDTFLLTINPINDAPVLAQPLSDVVFESGLFAFFIVPIATFDDIDGDTLTVTAALSDGSPLPDWLTFDGIAFSGTVPDDFAGDLEITVTASDGSLSTTDTFLVTVEGGNDLPIVINPIADQVSDEDQPVNFVVPADTFEDADGDTLTLTARLADGNELPLWLTFDGSAFTGTPPTDFNGMLSIEVTASDAEGGVTDTFVLNIAPVNDAPTIVVPVPNQTSDEDAFVSFDIPAGSFADVEGDTLTITAALSDGSALPSWLAFDGTTFSGQPPQDFSGTVSILLTVSDGTDEIGTSFDLIISEINDGPRAGDDTVAATEDQVQIIPIVDLLANDFDVENNAFELTSINSVTGGTAILDGSGNIVFTPDADFFGAASFTYEVTDIFGGAGQATVTVNVAAVNDAPVLAGVLLDQSSDEDTLVEFTLPADLFTDVDSAALTLTSTLADGSPLPAWLSFDGSTFSGTPPQDFNGNLQVAVIASDGEDQTQAEFELVITPVNDAPVADGAVSDVVVTEDTAFSVVLDDAFNDVDGDALDLVVTLANGDPLPDWVQFDPITRTLSGLPPQDFVGSLDLEITASDSFASASTTFILDVQGVNDAPIIVTPLVDVVQDEDTAVLIDIPDTTFSDVDGDALTLSASLANGDALPDWLTFDGTTLSGQPPQDFNGTIDIAIEASDGTASVSDSFALEFLPINDAPITVNDEGFSASAGADLILQQSELLANDSDPEGDPLEVIGVFGAGGGEVALSEEGLIVYTPDSDFMGTDSFSYVVSDGQATSIGFAVVTVGDPYSDYDQGTDGNDLLFGSLFQQNSIFGGDGDDIVFGGFLADNLAGGAGNDLLVGLSGNDFLEGNSGDDTLIGGFGADDLIGGTGSDILFGGRGQDTFHFAEGDESDIIADFQRGRSNAFFTIAGDKISLDVDGINSFADLMAVASEDGRDTVFDFGDGDVLVLNATRLAALDADMFTFT